LTPTVSPTTVATTNTPTVTPTDTPTTLVPTTTSTTTATPTATPTTTLTPVYYQILSCADSSTAYSIQYPAGTFNSGDRVITNTSVTAVIIGSTPTLPGGTLYTLTATGQTGCPATTLTPTATPTTLTPTTTSTTTATPTVTPTDTPTTLVPTTTADPYDYYVADEIDCSNCSVVAADQRVAFPTGTVVTLNRYYRYVGFENDFTYFVKDVTTPGGAVLLQLPAYTNCNVACGNATTLTPTTTTLEPTTTAGPSLYTHGAVRGNCSDYCTTNYLIQTVTPATADYLSLTIGDTIYNQGGYSGWVAYSNVSTNTSTGPFRIAQIDGFGIVTDIEVCNGSSCIPL